MLRKITDHIANPVNDRLEITVTDQPGAGGANHEYRIEATDDGSGKPHKIADHHISFQNGPIGEVGVNGITQEVLLAIVIDRLRSFQSGPFACKENGEALHHALLSLEALKSRTKARMARGVEGKNVA